MVELPTISHHIQKHILGILLHQKNARFRDLRPPRTDTNLFSYHLKLLLKQGYVRKVEAGYTLGDTGLAYIDRVSAKTVNIRQQPKIITMLVVQNSDGDILMQRRTKQPYIDTWTLPYGKLHIEDGSIIAAAQREAYEKLSLADQKVEHAGDCYIRVFSKNESISTTLAHVFRFERDDIVTSEIIQWMRPHKLNQVELAPAVDQIVARTFFRDPHFFEEYEVELV